MKKNRTLYILTFLLVVVSYLPNSFAQDIPYTVLEGHTRDVNSVAFSPDGKTFASGSSDKSIGLWETDTGNSFATIEVETIDRHGTFLHTLEGHTGRVRSVVFSPDGTLLASGSWEDETIRLWNTTTGEHIRTLIGHTSGVYSVAFSPDGTTLASGSKDGTIRLWNTTIGEHIRTLTGHSRWVGSVSFSPDGQTLASVSGDRTIRLWNAITGVPIKILTVNTVSEATFSPDGRYLASVDTSDNKIYLWHAHTGNEYRTLTVYGDVYSIAFSPDGQTLASGGRVIHQWNVPTGVRLASISQISPVVSVAFSPDGQTLASGNVDNTVHLWNASTGAFLHTFTGHNRNGRESGVSSVAFSSDGQTLASGGADNTVRLWAIDIPGYLRAIPMSGVSSVAFSSDGQTLASGSWDTNIRLWNASTGELTRTLIGHTNTVVSVAFSSDGELLASGSRDKTIRLWNAISGEVLNILDDSDTPISDIAFSPDGKTLASAHYARYGVIRLWDVTIGEVLNSFSFSGYSSSGQIFTSVAFSPDGHILAGGGRDNDKPVIQFWDVTTGEPTLRLIGHTATVTSIAFSPDGTMLASGSSDSLRTGGGFSKTHYDGSIGLWDTRTGKRLSTLEGHTDSVTSVAFSPDGSKLVSGGSGVIQVAGGDVFGTPILLWRLPNTRIRLTPIPVVSPAIGEQFTINVSIVSGENVGGYQMSLVFDPTVLRYVESANGDYLPPGSFFVPPVISHNTVTLAATSLTGVGAGDGTLATVTFKVLDGKESVIDLFDVILTDSAGEHLQQLPHIPTKVIEPTLLPTDAIISLTPSSVLSPALGERLTFNIDITGGQNVKDFWIMVDFDKSALKFLTWRVGGSPYLSNGIANGDGILETITFEVVDVKASTLDISGYLIAENGLRYKPNFEGAEVIIPLLGDVNRDGSVNILDLVLVASKFGQRVSGDPADVNEDGIVNIVDLVKVAGALGEGAAAPAVLSQYMDADLTRGDVQQWLTKAQQENLTDATSQQGILFLEQLLAALTPKETALLANYPNPFNPETWIPYQLAAPADVTLTIYTADGQQVRKLALGHPPVGIYQSKSRAAHWDGKNEVGEPVASGLYFYTLTAGEFMATRKMLILK